MALLPFSGPAVRCGFARFKSGNFDRVFNLVGTRRQYYVRDDMKDPFDQVGLDDIKLEDSLRKNAPLFQTPSEVFAE